MQRSTARFDASMHRMVPQRTMERPSRAAERDGTHRALAAITAARRAATLQIAFEEK